LERKHNRRSKGGKEEVAGHGQGSNRATMRKVKKVKKGCVERP